MTLPTESRPHAREKSISSSLRIPSVLMRTLCRPNRRVMDELETGYRLPAPPVCSPDVYSLMLACWHETADARPTFAELRTRLGKLVRLELGGGEDEAVVVAGRTETRRGRHALAGGSDTDECESVANTSAIAEHIGITLARILETDSLVRVIA